MGAQSPTSPRLSGALGQGCSEADRSGPKGWSHLAVARCRSRVPQDQTPWRRLRSCRLPEARRWIPGVEGWPVAKPLLPRRMPEEEIQKREGGGGHKEVACTWQGAEMRGEGGPKGTSASAEQRQSSREFHRACRSDNRFFRASLSCKLHDEHGVAQILSRGQGEPRFWRVWTGCEERGTALGFGFPLAS